jgi:hypothetical protein
MIYQLREFVIDPRIWVKLKTFHLNTTRGLTPKFVWNFVKLICKKIMVKILKISVGSKIGEMRNLYPVSWWGFWWYKMWSWVLESLGGSW